MTNDMVLRQRNASGVRPAETMPGRRQIQQTGRGARLATV